ncbi:MAG: MBL fold metallo-hydrolase, partial [Anaerolineaceae bacterium]|nr:MBL fold metallo-hydrolase [Anaerolineaceae bacterium]
MSQTIITIPLKVPAYLVKLSDGFILIDSGDASDCGKLEKALDQAAVTPENLKLVLLTHGDFDHAGNAAFLQQKYSAKVAIHANDAGMVERGDPGWNRKAKSDRVTVLGRLIIFISSHLAKPAPFQTFTPDILLADGQDLAEYGFAAQVLHLPGHSKGSLGIVTADGNLFCGDLLMNMVRPSLHFMIDDSTDFYASIEKLKKLNIQMVYPGHGKPFPLEQFLRSYREH